MSVSGAGIKDKEKNCPFFEELNEIFGHQPIVNQSGIDSTILQPSWTLEPSTIFECLNLYLTTALLHQEVRGFTDYRRVMIYSFRLAASTVLAVDLSFYFYLIKYCQTSCTVDLANLDPLLMHFLNLAVDFIKARNALP